MSRGKKWFDGLCTKVLPIAVRVGGDRRRRPRRRADRTAARCRLRAITASLDRDLTRWGPAGGVGFSLATGWVTVTLASDLDLLLRCPVRPARTSLDALASLFSGQEAGVDCQVETPAGMAHLDDLRRELAAMYIMISTARAARTMADVLDDLATSVSQTVRWRDVTGVIAERGTRFVLQLPPGRVLVRLARSEEESRGDSRVDVRAMSDTGLADNAFLVRRAAGETQLRLRRNRASVRADVVDFSKRMRLTASAVTDPGAAVAPAARVPGHGHMK
jgi:hypothetical protein